MSWKIEVFPNPNDPGTLEIQAVATKEDMPVASAVANDLIKQWKKPAKFELK